MTTIKKWLSQFWINRKSIAVLLLVLIKLKLQIFVFDLLLKMFLKLFAYIWFLSQTEAIRWKEMYTKIKHHHKNQYVKIRFFFKRKAYNHFIIKLNIWFQLFCAEKYFHTLLTHAHNLQTASQRIGREAGGHIFSFYSKLYSFALCHLLPKQ